MFKLKIALILVPVALLVCSTAWAQTDTKSNFEERKESFQAKRDEIKEKREEKIEERKNRFCNRVEAKIRNRVSNFKNHQKRRVNRHTRIVERITSLANNLDDKGYNTAQLRTHLKTYEGKIDEYEEEYEVFIEELSTSEKYTCGESEGKFVDQIKQARIKLGITRQKRAQIWEYYNQVIKKDLEELKNQQVE